MSDPSERNTQLPRLMSVVKVVTLCFLPIKKWEICCRCFSLFLVGFFLYCGLKDVNSDALFAHLDTNATLSEIKRSSAARNVNLTRVVCLVAYALLFLFLIVYTCPCLLTSGEILTTVKLQVLLMDGSMEGWTKCIILIGLWVVIIAGTIFECCVGDGKWTSVLEMIALGLLLLSFSTALLCCLWCTNKSLRKSEKKKDETQEPKRNTKKSKNLSRDLEQLEQPLVTASEESESESSTASEESESEPSKESEPSPSRCRSDCTRLREWFEWLIKSHADYTEQCLREWLTKSHALSRKLPVYHYAKSHHIVPYGFVGLWMVYIFRATMVFIFDGKTVNFIVRLSVALAISLLMYLQSKPFSDFRFHLNDLILQALERIRKRPKTYSKQLSENDLEDNVNVVIDCFMEEYRNAYYCNPVDVGTPIDHMTHFITYIEGKRATQWDSLEKLVPPLAKYVLYGTVLHIATSLLFEK